MVFDNEVERTISDDIRVITATEIPGTSFTGQAIPPRKGKIRTERHLAGLVESRFADVVNGLYSDRLHLVERRNDGKSNSFSMSDRYDKALTVRLDVIPLPAGIVARTYVNTTSDNHTIQLPDTIDAQQVDRALSHELGELLAVRKGPGSMKKLPFKTV